MTLLTMTFNPKVSKNLYLILVLKLKLVGTHYIAETPTLCCISLKSYDFPLPSLLSGCLRKPLLKNTTQMTLQNLLLIKMVMMTRAFHCHSPSVTEILRLD